MRRSAVPAVALVVSAVVIVVAALLGSGGGSGDGDPSSRSAGRLGTLALYTWLGDGLGYDVHRVTGSFDLSGSDVLVVDTPVDQVGAEDARAVARFVDGGGVALVAVDATSLQAAASLLASLGVEPVGVVAGGAAAAAQPLDAGDTVRRVPMGDALELGGRDAVPLLTLAGRTVAVGVAHGRGRAVVLGSPLPLSNDGLRHDDSARLVLSLVERARGGRIGFDEVHHGEGPSAGAAAVLVSPVGLALLLAALVLLALLASAGRRPGRPVPVGDPARVPTAGDYVAAVAQLLERSRRRGPVATRYADELKARVGAAAGVEPGLDDERFCALLEPYGPAAEAVRDVLRRARALALGSPGDADLLRLARAVDEVEARWASGAPEVEPSAAGVRG